MKLKNLTLYCGIFIGTEEIRLAFGFGAFKTMSLRQNYLVLSMQATQ